jgi:hypothetical protein
MILILKPTGMRSRKSIGYMPRISRLAFVDAAGNSLEYQPQ